VFVSPIKEPCFFAPEVAEITPRDRLVLDWNDYRQLFKDVGRETAIGEASVAYLASLKAPAAIHARLPDARIVMILRNPIDRLFSRYLAARDSGDTASFEEWLDLRIKEDESRDSSAGSVDKLRGGPDLAGPLRQPPPAVSREFPRIPGARVRIRRLRQYTSYRPARALRVSWRRLGVSDRHHPASQRDDEPTVAGRAPAAAAAATRRSPGDGQRRAGC
jgi:hypothetical protein